MRVKILRKDAKRGNYLDNQNCPVGRALKREGFKDVHVGGSECWVGHKMFTFPCGEEPGGWNPSIMKRLANSKRKFRWLTLTEVK